MGEGKAVLRIPPEFLDQIKSKLNLVDLVSEHVVLRKSGANHVGLCPFHSERSPSFSVSEQKQVYHCYGCHAGGDLIRFVQEMDGLSFPEAVKDLAKRAGVAIPESLRSAFRSETGSRAEAQKNEDILYRLNLFVASRFRKRLEHDTRARAYLAERGVAPSTESAFFLGSAPAAWDWLAKEMAAAKVPMEAAEKLGLVRKSERNSGEFFDLFRDRLMFPIFDVRGRVIAFGGRIFPGAPDVNGAKPPKYLNSPESVLFQKSRTLYGIHTAKKYIRELDEAIVVEGYFDVLGMVGAGFHNTVATCGTALTADHLRALQRFGQKVTLLFDGDRAGQEAMDRGMISGLEQGIAVYGAVLPEGLDPDEYVAKNGREAMTALLGAAQPILDRRMGELSEAGRTNLDVRTQNLKKVAEWLRLYRDPVGRALRVDQAAKLFHVAPGLIWEAMGERPTAVPQPRPEFTPQRKAPPRVPAEISRRDRVLIQSLFSPALAALWAEIRDRMPQDVVKGRAAGLLSDLFQHPALRKFTGPALDRQGWTPDSLSQQVERLAREKIATTAAPEESTDDSVLRNGLIEVLMNADSVPDVAMVRSAILQGLQQIWARFSQQVRAAMVDAESRNDSGNQARLMQEYLDVQRRMKELNNFYE